MLNAIAVIRKVEDSPDSLDRRLVAAYLQTDYMVHSLPFGAIRIGEENAMLERWLEEHGVATFAFITAWNPGSNPLSPAENRRRNRQLETALKKVCRQVWPGLGAGSDPAWPPEESFWALGISAENSVRLARQFGQNAVVWWEKGGVAELWWVGGLR